MTWDNPELYERAKICALNGHPKGVQDIIKKMSYGDVARFSQIISLAKGIKAKTPDTLMEGK
tara:strand:- start:279 stop:464 length:186 start_codon:yes stop_codon:yes gene_type:complete